MNRIKEAAYLGAVYSVLIAGFWVGLGIETAKEIKEVVT